MAKYKALDSFEIRTLKPTGAMESKRYEKGNFVSIPENYEENPQIMERVNSARRGNLNEGTGFDVTYVETVTDEDGKLVEEEFTRQVILPVAPSK